MKGKMWAAVLHRRLELRLEEREIPSPGPGQVLVKPKAVGICGSDVHFWHDGRVSTRIVTAPLILGHKCAGEVAELGQGVEALKVGDRVALEPGVPCGQCILCRTGRYNLCPQVRFLAAPPTNGAFVEYLAHPAAFAYRLPESLSYEEGALLEPLSVGLHAVERGEVRVGDRVLITGAGPIGLVTMFAARASGAAQTFLSDIKPHRLKLARELGADEVLDTQAVSVPERIMELTEGLGADVALDCSGAPPAIDACLASVKRSGTLVLVGTGLDAHPFPVNRLVDRELTVRGTYRYANTYPAAIRLAASGKVDLKPLVTHHFPLAQIEQAMQLAAAGGEGAVKVIISIETHFQEGK